MSVVDASVWVSRLLPQDVHHATSRTWLGEYLAADQLVVAPVVLLAEVAGAISRRTGRPRLASGAVDALLALPSLRLVALDSQLAIAASRLAAELGLRGADALYVAVAQHLGLPLVSWDDEQRERARRVVEVHVPPLNRSAQ